MISPNPNNVGAGSHARPNFSFINGQGWDPDPTVGQFFKNTKRFVFSLFSNFTGQYLKAYFIDFPT